MAGDKESLHLHTGCWNLRMLLDKKSFLQTRLLLRCLVDIDISVLSKIHFSKGQLTEIGSVYNFFYIAKSDGEKHKEGSSVLPMLLSN